MAKIIIKFESTGYPTFACGASAFDAEGRYIAHSYVTGKTWEEARAEVIDRVRVLQRATPPDEEVDI